MTQDLIERLEKAEAGSRELDGLLWLWERPTYRLIGYADRTNQCWQDFGIGRGDVQNPQCWVRGTLFRDDTGQVQAYASPPPVTTSLDIALALAERVLPGCSWRVQKDFGGFIVAVRNGIHEVEVEADTPALALCTALLRAHREGEGRS